MVGANDVTHRLKPSESVRCLDLAVRRLRERGTRGRRRHLPGPRHRRADPAAAALTRPPLEPPARRRADRRRRRGRRPHGLARRPARPRVRGPAARDVLRRPLPPLGRRLRAGRRRAAAQRLRRPRPAARRARRAAPGPAHRRGPGRRRPAAARAVAEPGTEVSAGARSPAHRGPGPLGRLLRRGRRRRAAELGQPQAGRREPASTTVTTARRPAGSAVTRRSLEGRVRRYVGPSLGRSRARGRRRRHRPLADRPGFQGVPQGRPPRRPRGDDRRRRARQGAPASPAGHRRPLPRLRRAVGGARREHGPRRGRAARSRPPAGRHGQPVLLLLRADHADGVPRHQGRRGRRFVSAGVECVSRYKGFGGAGKNAADDWDNPVFAPARSARRRRRRPTRPGTTRATTARSPTSTSRWARPPRTWPRCAGVTRRAQDEWGVESQNRAEKATPTASSRARSPR